MYSQTEHLTLISCFISEIFLGNYTQIDTSDGSGMNMMDIKEKKWSPLILDYISNSTKTEFINKLGGEPKMSYMSPGVVCAYFIKRYGFSESCLVVYGTGDNPATVIGLGIFNSGEISISLGSSDTVLALVDEK